MWTREHIWDILRMIIEIFFRKTGILIYGNKGKSWKRRRIFRPKMGNVKDKQWYFGNHVGSVAVIGAVKPGVARFTVGFRGRSLKKRRFPTCTRGGRGYSGFAVGAFGTNVSSNPIPWVFAFWSRLAVVSRRAIQPRYFHPSIRTEGSRVAFNAFKARPETGRISVSTCVTRFRGRWSRWAVVTTWTFSTFWVRILNNSSLNLRIYHFCWDETVVFEAIMVSFVSDFFFNF